MQPVTQPTSAPVPKVAAVGLSGLVLTLLIAVAGVFHVTLPASFNNNVMAVATGVAAIVSIIHFAVGYFKKDTIPAPTVPNPSLIVPQNATQPVDPESA